MPSAQEIIHKLEEGAGARLVKLAAICLAIGAMVLIYNWRCYRNLSTIEAMDAAQVARNLSQGQGFSTLCIRPFSIYLITNEHAGRPIKSSITGTTDPGMLKQPHPDLANPPVYPLALAGLMKVLPFNWDIPGVVNPADKNRDYFWNRAGNFWWYPPDFFIALFNQALLVVIVWLSYKVAERLFDAKVALLSALLVIGAEILWRFSVSGLPTLLLCVWFLLLIRCLIALESGLRENKLTPPREVRLVVAIGLLVGLGAMTRYAYAWIMAPVVGFLLWCPGRRRFSNAGLATVVFLLVCAPWVARNVRICGEPFGTATFSYLENTTLFPQYKLERSLSPELSSFEMRMFWRKTMTNLRAIVNSDLPRLAGSWISAFFLVSLLLRFRNPGINRMKYFLGACLLTFVLVQAVGQTAASEESPEINADNLLVITAPLVFIFGAALYRVLRDQIRFDPPEMRIVADIGFIAVASVPLALAFLPPRTSAVAYPPYYPPLIQRVSNWMRPNELMMSDAPWAVAWIGRRQCIWNTTDATEQFTAVSDNFKDVRALYLTARTTDSRFVTGWIQPLQDRPWGALVLEVALRHEVPTGFPLRNAPAGFPIPDQIFLSDRVRWQDEKIIP